MFHLIEAMRNEIEACFENSGDQISPTNEVFNMSSVMLESEEHAFDNLNISDSEKKVLKVLTDELRDILESQDYVSVFREASSGAFTVLHKHLEEMMMSSHQQQQLRRSQQQENNQYPVEENVVKIHMATVVPRLTKETKTILDGSEENEYVWTVHENLMLNKYSVIGKY
jgi:hypothetical protein